MFKKLLALLTRNNKRANQNQQLQPLLGVVLPQETKQKKDKDKK
jgi:hypothetical protein